jgi:hypothetical protein
VATRRGASRDESNKSWGELRKLSKIIEIHRESIATESIRKNHLLPREKIFLPELFGDFGLKCGRSRASSRLWKNLHN